MNSIDGKSELQMLSFQAPKIRLLRSLSIETEAMQVSFSVIHAIYLDIVSFQIAHVIYHFNSSEIIYCD
jgi:phytochromobilin:ferredoxin oxidoreductase